MGNWFTAINHPDFIRHCFVENRKNYRFQKIRQSILKPIIGDGLITAEGPTWSHARRAMSPMFTPKNIRHFGAVMQETTAREMPEIFKDGADIKIAPALSKLTYLVLSDTLFSGDIDADQSQVLRDVATALAYMGRPDPLDFMGAPDWVPRLTRLPGLKSAKRLRRLIAQVIDKRQAARQSGHDMPDDFLTRLLAVGDDDMPAFTPLQIEDHMIAFIGAGHETTARGLAWLLYLLANDESVRQKLEAEVDGLDVSTPPETWIDTLPYALACFEETMRLFPPAPMIVREAIDDDVYATSFIPGGSVVMVNTWQLHRHETLWENPERFDPERFMGKARENIDRFQYLPFGVGERVCIGQRFALQEAVILIALLIRSYRFDYAGKAAPWPIMRITVKPDNDMPMRAARR